MHDCTEVGSVAMCTADEIKQQETDIKYLECMVNAARAPRAIRAAQAKQFGKRWVAKTLSLSQSHCSLLFAEQFTPQQMLDVMTKSPKNRDVRVHDGYTSRRGFNTVSVDHSRSAHEL